MPDFGIGELIAGLGEGAGLADLFGAAAAPELTAATVPLDIGAGLGFGAGADTAALEAATSGLSSGLGQTVGLGALAGSPGFGATVAETLGAGAGGLDLAGPGFGTVGSGGPTSGVSSFAPSTPPLEGLTTNVAVPGVSSTGPITTAESVTGALGASPAAPIGGAGTGAGGGGATDLASIADQTGMTSGGGSSGGAATGGAATGDKSFLSSLGTGAINQVTKNPLGALGGAALLGTSFLGNKQPPGQPQLSAIAPLEATSGLANQQYLTTGTLPPAIKANVDAASQAAKAKIISNYANRGLPTDPTKNSSLAAELAQVDQNAVITTGQIGQQLLTAGLDQTKLSTDIYNKLVGIDQTQQAAIQKALASFAAAMGGGGLKLNIGGSSTG